MLESMFVGLERVLKKAFGSVADDERAWAAVGLLFLCWNVRMRLMRLGLGLLCCESVCILYTGTLILCTFLA